MKEVLKKIKEFSEKCKADSKFKTKTQLGFYTAFVIAVSIFAIVTNKTISTSPIENLQQKDVETSYINIPKEYRYTINIELNGENYKYTGSKQKGKEEIVKSSANNQIEYIYKNNKYFEVPESITSIIEKEKVYDIIDYNYLNLETINKYISIATKEKDEYTVYLKDIVFASTYQGYITIKRDKNKTKILLFLVISFTYV